VAAFHPKSAIYDSMSPSRNGLGRSTRFVAKSYHSTSGTIADRSAMRQDRE
jgi:hypothetical protein